MSTKTQKQMKYLELISQNAEEERKEDLQFAADDAVLAVQSAINETKKSLALARRNLTKVAKAVPYDLEAHVEAIQKVESLEEGLKLAEKIKKENFTV